LTDLWQIQGSIFEKTPLDWVRLETTQKLLKGLVEPNETVVVWSESKAKEQSNVDKPLIAEVPGVLEVTQEGDELWT
jgi:DTW domain-containing protein YfiP